MSAEQDIIKDFLIEAIDGLDRLDQEFLYLEKNRNSNDTLNSIFRIIHTIKGTSGFFGFSKLEKITHLGESLLDSLKNSKLQCNDDIFGALFHLLDAMRQILTSIEKTNSEGSSDITELCFLLEKLNRGSALIVESPDQELERLLAENQKALWATDQTDSNQAMISNKSESEGSEFVDQTVIKDEFYDPGKEQKPATEVPMQTAPAESKTTPAPSVNEEGSKSALTDTSLRVDVGLLDSLMNLVGELVLARNQIAQYSKNNKDQTFLSTAQRLSLITGELQESVMKTRMQPISTVWTKFPRVVRDLARQLQKEVRLEMEGKETELDKTIIEAIKDPLTHIIRNSVDHGIELPSVRLEKGKKAEGVIRLDAHHEGGQVILEISDDGAGLNTERIKQKALEKGIVPADELQQMSDQEIHRIILRPGFSTAEAVTNISGRGVGMDVVKSNIERIGGAVDIISQHGQGSTIRIKIPLTLAILPALIVTCDGEKFAIPQVVLTELVQVDADNRKLVETIGGSRFYRLRGNLLRLVSLREQLNLKRKSNEDPEHYNIVVLKSDEESFGLIVDEVHDTEEIVVKPLGKQLKSVSVFAGASVMGDGQVALILDALGIAKRAKVIESSKKKIVAVEAEQRKSGNRQSLLLVKINSDYRAALALDLVHRLEQFNTSDVENAGGRSVIQYRSGILPLIDLNRVLTGDTTAQKNEVQVVVLEDGNEMVGFVVDRVEDIVEEEIVLNGKRKRPGTLGAAVVQKRVTELLNPAEIIAGEQV